MPGADLARDHPAVLIVLGMVYLFFGWRTYKFTVVLTGAIIGFACGLLIAEVFELRPIVPALICALLYGLIAWPLQKVVLFLMGGLVGAAIVSVAARGHLLPFETLLAALVGFILAGIIALWLLKPMVITLTAMYGAASCVLGFGILIARLKAGFFDVEAFCTSTTALLIFLAVAAIGVVSQWRTDPGTMTGI